MVDLADESDEEGRRGDPVAGLALAPDPLAIPDVGVFLGEFEGEFKFAFAFGGILD